MQTALALRVVSIYHASIGLRPSAQGVCFKQNPLAAEKPPFHDYSGTFLELQGIYMEQRFHHCILQRVLVYFNQ